MCTTSVFLRTLDGKSQHFDSIEPLAQFLAENQAAVWVDLQQATPADLRAVDEIFFLDDEAIEDSLQGEQRPRIDQFDDHFLMISYGFIADGQDDEEIQPRKLSVFCGKDFLITVHDEQLKTITVLGEQYLKQPSETLERGVDGLLFSILDMVTDNYLFVAEQYEDELEDLEEQSFDPQIDDKLHSVLSDFRRRLIVLRRVAARQQVLVSTLAHSTYEFISPDVQKEFDHVLEHLAKVIEQIDGMRELLYGVRDNYHAALSRHSNEIMQALTVYAAIMLPLGVIAGIYGMNLEIWPSDHHPHGFVGVLAVMGAIAVGSLAYCRWRRWL